MMSIRFGPQDVLAVFPTGDLSSTPRSPGRAAQLGLTCYEYMWITPGAILADPSVVPQDVARRLGDGIDSHMHIRNHVGREVVRLELVDKRHPKRGPLPEGMTLSSRESFNWSLADEGDAKRMEYLFRDWLGTVRRLGVQRLCLHLGSAAGHDRETAMDAALRSLEVLLRIKRRMRMRKVQLAVETAAAPEDLGSLEEVARCCDLDECVIPCLVCESAGLLTDGSLLDPATYAEIFDRFAYEVDEERRNHMHIEFSPRVVDIAKEESQGALGWEQFFAPMATSMAERGMRPWIIFSDRAAGWPASTEETEDMQAAAAARMRDLFMSETDRLF